MKTLTITLSIALLLGLSALTVNGLQSASASAACATSNSMTLELISGSVTVKAGGFFDYVLLAKWNTKGKPFMGQVLLGPNFAPGVQGVKLETVRYSIDSFFPSACSGEVAIRVTGQKLDTKQPGWLATLVQVGPNPNFAQINQVEYIP